jgi:hypothetical protein
MEIRGDVPFPYTTSAPDGGGFGRIVVTHEPLAGVQYAAVEQLTARWYIDVALLQDASSSDAVYSALNQHCADQETAVTMVCDKKISGASLGLACFLACMGIRTDVAVTGFIQSFGAEKPSLPIQAIDNADEKMRIARRYGRKLILPTASSKRPDGKELHRGIVDGSVYTFAHGIERLRPNPALHCAAADGVADLLFILRAYDGNVVL